MLHNGLGDTEMAGELEYTMSRPLARERRCTARVEAKLGSGRRTFFGVIFDIDNAGCGAKPNTDIGIGLLLPVFLDGSSVCGCLGRPILSDIGMFTC